MMQKSVNQNNVVPPCRDCTIKSVVEGILHCTKCGRKYPIMEEIPIILPDYSMSNDAVKGLERFDAMACNAPIYEKKKSLTEEERKKLLIQLIKKKFEISSNHSEFVKNKALNDMEYRIKHADKKDYYFETFQHLLSKSPKRVLDIGMGQGGLLTCMKRHLNFPINVGIEISFDWFKIAKIRDPSIFLVNCDGTSLPFRSESFDFVISSSTLEHVKDWEKIIRELHFVSDECFLVFGPNKFFPIDFGHFGSVPFITLLPPSIGKYIISFWYRLKGENANLVEMERRLRGMSYISPFDFEKTCKKCGFTIFNLFSELLISNLNYDYNYFPKDTFAGKLIILLKKNPKYTNMLAKTLTKLKLNPMLCYFLVKKGTNKYEN